MKTTLQTHKKVSILESLIALEILIEKLRLLLIDLNKILTPIMEEIIPEVAIQEKTYFQQPSCEIRRRLELACDQMRRNINQASSIINQVEL